MTLLIERTKAQEKELKELSQNVMKQQPNQNTATSILSRQTRLVNRLKELKLHVDLLDDDGQLSQSSGGIRDDVSMISSRGNRSRRSTPVSIDNNEVNQLRRNLEQQKSSTAHPNQPPAIPPRPGRPTLFLQQLTAPKINYERVLGAHQRQTEMQNLEIRQQEQNLAGTDNHVRNPFTQVHDTLVFNSATGYNQYAAINPNNQSSSALCSLQIAPITLDNKEANENHSLNLLPPITNLSISSDTTTAKSEYGAQNFSNVSITEHLFSKPVTEKIFIFQTPNRDCHDTQKERIARNNKSKSNPVIQHQSLQAFAQDIDCIPSKNFNTGSQDPTQFPTNANSCPQPTKNQSKVVAETLQLQIPQYAYATHAEQVTQQKKFVLPFEQQNPQLFQQFNKFVSTKPQSFPHKTALQFSTLPQNYTQELTNKPPGAQLCSQPTVLPNNLQHQNQTAPDFPASSMPLGSNAPNFVDP